MIEDPKELLQRARKWIEDLRSGNFNQGRCKWYGIDNNSLQPGYCCLGVCGSQSLDLASAKFNLAIGGVHDETEEMRQVMHIFPVFLSCEYSWPNIIPRELWHAELGFDNLYEESIIPRKLAELNDDYVSFEKIAWVIEETLIPHLELKVNELHEDC